MDFYTVHPDVRKDLKYVKQRFFGHTLNNTSSLCSDVLLRACPKNDRDRRVNCYIIALFFLWTVGIAAAVVVSILVSVLSGFHVYAVKDNRQVAEFLVVVDALNLSKH